MSSIRLLDRDLTILLQEANAVAGYVDDILSYISTYQYMPVNPCFPPFDLFIYISLCLAGNFRLYNIFPSVYIIAFAFFLRSCAGSTFDNVTYNSTHVTLFANPLSFVSYAKQQIDLSKRKF